MKITGILIFLFTNTFYTSIETLAQVSENYELVSIDFEGNNNFSKSELLSVIQSQENPFWLWRFLNSFTPLGSGPVYFDSTSLPIDLISLTSYYAVNGFFQTDLRYSYDSDQSTKEVRLTYIISEGDYHTYGKISTQGLEALDEFMNSKISPYLQFDSLGRYIQVNVEEKMNDLVTELKNDGYMLVTFDSSRISIDTLQNKTNLISYFTLGNYYRYNEIRIVKEGVGKDLVSDELIEYVTNIKIGDPYKEEVLAKSRLRLARTSLFTSVNVNGVEGDTTGSYVPLLVRGTIGPLNELSPEVFADNELNTFNVGIGLSYIRKNFLGDARKLTLRTRLRADDITNLNFSSSQFKESLQGEVDFTMILEQPFLFSRTVSGRLETFAKSYRISTVDYQNFGAVFTSSFDMPSYTFINLVNPYFRLDRLVYEFPAAVPEVPDTFIVNTRTFTTSLGLETGSTKTDDLFYPTKGETISLITEVASSDVLWESDEQLVNNALRLISDTGYYYKLQLTFGMYRAVSKDKNTVVGIKAKSGYIQMIDGGQELISPNQTFFAGGSNSVRGWRARELVPPEQVEYIGAPDINEELKIRGGTFLIEGSFEYRRRFETDLGFALFVDYGNTWNSYKEVRWNNIAWAIGTGIRYYSPIAPFRIDFGFKLYDPGNGKFFTEQKVFDTLEFHFGIGEAF